MRCIYFDGTKCFARGFNAERFSYTPNKDEKESYCENLKFRTCARFDAYLDDKKATK